MTSANYATLKIVPASKLKGSFIEPMLLLRTEKLSESANWLYELKYDGFRALVIKTEGRVCLRSRNNNDFTSRYPTVAKALASIPNETVLDGEIVALDQEGKPSFNVLQNYSSSTAPLFYYVFDVMIIRGRDVMNEPLERRRELVESAVSKVTDPVRISPQFNASLADLIASVKAQGLEGIVAKRKDSRYEPGQRSGAWQKMRINRGQEFVIGGYTPSPKNFDALIFGYYASNRLLYVARTRNGFTPHSRAELFAQFRGLETTECPFANLPEARSGRWGQGLTAAKMAECRWLRPLLVGQFEFVEWTPDNHLRHSRFLGLREDKKPREVRKES